MRASEADRPARLVVLVDFDGTIARLDLSDEVMRRHADLAAWAPLEAAYLAGEIGSRTLLTRQAAALGSDTTAKIGSRRRERYVFTRRGLLSILEYLASPLCETNGTLDARAVRRALLRYYLGRLSTNEDRNMVVQLLDAHGIGPNTWTLSI